MKNDLIITYLIINFSAFVQVIVCNCIEDLHQYVDKKELTTDLDGNMPYCHQHWIQQRIVSILSYLSCFDSENPQINFHVCIYILQVINLLAYHSNEVIE